MRAGSLADRSKLYRDLASGPFFGFNRPSAQALARHDRFVLAARHDDDQIVPIAASAQLSAKLVKSATLKVYKGAPHGLTDTHKTQLNEDLLAFVRG